MGGFFSYYEPNDNNHHNWIRDYLDNRDLNESYIEKSDIKYMDLRKHCPGIYNSKLFI